MRVVADAGPLHYLVLLGRIDVLQALYGEVIAPATVVRELSHPRAPAVVRTWIAAPIPWLLVHAGAAEDHSLSAALDPGERAAIALVQEIGADLLLADDRAARDAARARGANVVGTIGILDLAARQGLLDLAVAIKDLRATNFRCPTGLLDALLAAHRARHG